MEEHNKSGESNTCLCCGRTFATRIWLYKHCAADHPENEDIRPERPVKVKGLRLAHLHERKNLECGLPGCDLTFTCFKVDCITFIMIFWIKKNTIRVVTFIEGGLREKENWPLKCLRKESLDSLEVLKTGVK